MPQGNGYNSGVGLVSFADNFLKSFTQTKLMKHQETLMKNREAIDLLKDRLHDDTLPYYKQAQIIDNIGYLAGIKEPLSRRIGMDKWNEQQVNDPNNPAKKGTPQQTLTDPNLPADNEYGATNNIQMQGTKDTAQGLTARGNLSPADIKFKLKLAENKAIDDEDVTKQIQILQANYILQKNILNKGGYTKEVFRGKRGNDYVIVYTNGEDERTINLGPNATPDMIEKANISANTPKGKYGQLQTAHDIVDQYDKNPNLVTQAQYKAAKDVLDEFETTGKLNDAKIASLTQGVTGNPPKPITPAQSADDARANAQIQLNLQTARDNANSKAIESSAKANEAAQLAHNQEQNVVTPLKNQRDAILKDRQLVELSEDEKKEYYSLDAKYRTELNRYNDLKTAADSAAAIDKGNKQSLQEAESRLNNSNLGNSSTDQRYAPAINVFRKNPKNAQYANWTDQQIIDYLKSKGLIK